jgi:phosphatidylglycerophosphate synthase
LKTIPLLLTALRAALAPVVMLLAVFAPSKPAFGVCLILAFVSDVFDGILARRLGVATPNLRRLDSIADSLFYLTATMAVWRLYPSAISGRPAPLTALVLLEACRYAYDWVKFKREASYHMWSSKLWGVCLFAGFFSLLAFGVDGPLVDVAIYVGIAADLEGLAISLTLRRWQNDVPSIVHAVRLRAIGR